MKTAEKIKGTVKWYQPVQGYGFIAGDDGVDYFAHHSEIKMTGFRKLKGKQRVSFIPHDEEKGRKEAKEIELM